ncbi:MAG TPA: hypothetical protein VEO54_16650 [Thermoanaerobaculia bacterium]|nr:hypothetical protein [Thermoanaerobaculia bacterium]
MHRPIRFGLALLMLFSFTALAEDYTAPGVNISVGDPAGARFKSLASLEVGDSLSVELSGANPGSTVEMLLLDDKGREWSYSRVHSNKEGAIPRTLFWYQSGVIGTTSRKIDFRPDPAFIHFDEAEEFFAGNRLQLIVRERGREGRLLAVRDIRPAPRRTPFVYPSNKDGVLENAVNAANETLYVSGRNFPAGARVQLFLVPNRHGWAPNDEFEPVAAQTIVLGRNETRFTAEVVPAGKAVAGAYDIIARVADDDAPVVLANDIISFGEDTGVVLYFIIINGNTVIESAGRVKSGGAYFEFSNFFEKGEDVWGAVDPTDVPAGHTGGSYAAHWTVAHQPAAYWDGVNPPLVDVSGDGPEIHRVKYFCINGTRIRLWQAATQAAPIAGYDVIVDFGAVPAIDAASFVHDNTYNKGLDFIDGYSDVGFWVGERPDATGPYAVGTVEYLDPAGISGITDPAGVTGPTYPINLGWARIMYPATAAGTGTPVAPGGPYPVALFLHGRHFSCDNDGAGPGLSGGFGPCAQPNRIPSHEGYNYIMEKLASQGVFCISISAHDIQFDGGVWNYNVRGRLILKFLDKLRDWTNLGTDPFGLFNGKIDMSKVALSGHSRGGEGVVAADQLNATWPTPHSIVAVNAIAPTDQDATVDYLPSVPYYLLIAARDGDVSNMQGFRTYDHAFPQGMANREMKASAWVYGANHNYFNTIWTPTADLGSPNPWAGSVDDCPHSPTVNQPQLCQLKMTAAVQRQVALSTVTAFFRWHLQNAGGYREILTGVLEPAAMDNANVFWTFQDGDRNAIDNFEQQPPFDPSTNTVGGMVTAPGFTMFQERLLNSDSTSYSPAPLQDSAFRHDTIGLKLGWATPQVYTTHIPPGPNRNVSMYTHFTLRAGKKTTVIPTAAGPDVVLYVQLEDGAGHVGFYQADTSNYQRIPHPFLGSESPNLATLTGIRIPLQNFTKNNSQVDLTDIVKITITTTGSAEIGLDDIEFGK